MPDWLLIAGGVFVAWFIIDMSARAYLIWSPREDYKNDQTEREDATYRQEKEAEALEILSRYRIGRWLLRGRNK